VTGRGLPTEDALLAEQSRRGDPRALASLYRQLAPPLLGFLVRRLGDRAEAEDVLHDTFLRLLDDRRGGGPDHVRPWLFTVAGHLALDRLRRRKRRGELLAAEGAGAGPAGPPDPEGAVEHRELRDRIEAALADLPPTYAAAFHLRVRERLPYREIAHLLGDAEGTLRSRVHHALARVRRSLQRLGYERPSPRARKERTE